MFSNNLVGATHTRLSVGVVTPLSLSFAILAIVLVAFSCGFAQATTITVATSGDPSENSLNPLFTADFRAGTMKLTGGWADTKTGLTLEVPYSDHTIANRTAFSDAWFKMDDVIITSTGTLAGLGTYGLTGPGTINFYAHGTTANPLVTINFQSSFVSGFGFSADNAENLNGVKISGSEISGTLSEERFSFAFANNKNLTPIRAADGFTATASFTSSAIPEPSTLILLGMGTLAVAGWLWRKRSAVSA